MEQPVASRVVSGLENLVFGSMHAHGELLSAIILRSSAASSVRYERRCCHVSTCPSGVSRRYLPRLVSRRGWCTHFCGRSGLQDGDYFLHCSRYIHLNPVKAHLRAMPDDYAWSSYLRYLGSDLGLDWIDGPKRLTVLRVPPTMPPSCFKDCSRTLPIHLTRRSGVSFSAAMPLLRSSARSCARLT